MPNRWGFRRRNSGVSRQSPSSFMHLRAFATLLAISAMCARCDVTQASEIDEIDLKLRIEIQTLQSAFERNVQSKKAEAVRKYEVRLEEARRAKKTDLVNEIAAKIAALKMEPAPEPLAPPPPSPAQQRVLGKWVLENAKGGTMGEMTIEKIGDEVYKLTRVGGGAFAINGTYRIEADKFVKIAQPGQPHVDMEWRITGTRLRLSGGQYKDWILRRPK